MSPVSSPFVLAIEPLAMAIRSNKKISGNNINNIENKIGLHVDDVSLLLTDLKSSIPTLLDTIEKFGSFSGYKVNVNKSTIMFLNHSERLVPPLTTPFRNVMESFTYLGVKITTMVDDWVPANYNNLVNSVVDSINRWKHLPISMIGQINILKRNILPKFLHLFHTIPLPPPPDLFIKMKQICHFIWNNRRSRLRLTLLYLPYVRGGLGVPFLQGYYWAAQLRAATCWFESKSTLYWVRMEKTTTSKIPLSLYLYSANLSTLRMTTLNPFIRKALAVWLEVLNH